MVSVSRGRSDVRPFGQVVNAPGGVQFSGLSPVGFHSTSLAAAPAVGHPAGTMRILRSR